MYKRIIFALLYSKGEFHLSRNFRLQKVGDVDWLKNNFGFGETCDFIDELIIINVTPRPSGEDYKKFFSDIKKLRKRIFVPITLGGGIRKIENAKECFDNGADKILINYLAQKNKKIFEKISHVFGAQSISASSWRWRFRNGKRYQVCYRLITPYWIRGEADTSLPRAHYDSSAHFSSKRGLPYFEPTFVQAFLARAPEYVNTLHAVVVFLAVYEFLPDVSDI